MAALAPTVLPGLQRSLEVAFLAGFATSRSLPGSQAAPSSSSRMPSLPQRFKLISRESAKVQDVAAFPAAQACTSPRAMLCKAPSWFAVVLEANMHVSDSE